MDALRYMLAVYVYLLKLALPEMHVRHHARFDYAHSQKSQVAPDRDALCNKLVYACKYV